MCVPRNHVVTEPSDSRAISRAPRQPWSRGAKIAMLVWTLVAVALLSGFGWVLMRIESASVTPTLTQADEAGPPTPVAVGATRPPAAARSLTFSFAPHGAVFTPSPADPAAAPTVQILTVPEFSGYSAIWGATGRDHRGHVWLGVSTRGQGFAHLVEYIPVRNELDDHGSVGEQLKRLDLYHDDMGQIKIHSRIEQARDGYLYFASMDEEGERSDGTRNPTWGSHLWRVATDAPQKWQRLAAVPEGLIAVSCGGRMVYALGYHDHVLYQYDTETGGLRSVTVGSVGGHISRNFIADHRDHAFVPRVQRDEAGDGDALRVMLVEFDVALNEIAATPLEAYGNEQSHGIVAFQALADRSILFTTHEGMLYRIEPPADGDAPARIDRFGYFHPDGSRYIASMFTYDGTRYVMGVCQNKANFQWVCYDLAERSATVTELPIDYPDGRTLSKHLLYGSITRDRDGGFFLVGTDQSLDRPVALRLVAPQ